MGLSSLHGAWRGRQGARKEAGQPPEPDSLRCGQQATMCLAQAVLPLQTCQSYAADAQEQKCPCRSRVSYCTVACREPQEGPVWACPLTCPRKAGTMLQVVPEPCLPIASASHAWQACCVSQAQPDKPYLGKTHNGVHLLCQVLVACSHAADLLQRCGQDATYGPGNETASSEHQSHASQRQDVRAQGQGQQNEDAPTNDDGVRHKVCTAAVWLSARWWWKAGMQSLLGAPGRMPFVEGHAAAVQHEVRHRGCLAPVWLSARTVAGGRAW